MSAQAKGEVVVAEHLAELLGVNHTDLRCLDLLEQRGGLDRGGAGPGQRAVQPTGYAHRVGDPNDRRPVAVVLTVQAKARIKALHGPIGDEGRRVLERYSTEELELFCDFLRRGRDLNLSEARRLEQLARGAATPEEGRRAAQSTA